MTNILTTFSILFFLLGGPKILTLCLISYIREGGLEEEDFIAAKFIWLFSGAALVFILGEYGFLI